MNITQYNALGAASSKPIEISINDIPDKSDRTLLWGYTCNRESFHVYLKDRQLHRLIYDFNHEMLNYQVGESLTASILHHDKRIYPEATDYDFARLLYEADETPCFTTFNEKREQSSFYGLMKEELVVVPEKLKRLNEIVSKLQIASSFLVSIEVFRENPQGFLNLDDLQDSFRDSVSQTYLSSELITIRRLALAFTGDEQRLMILSLTDMSLEESVAEFKKLAAIMIESSKYVSERMADCLSGAEKIEEAFSYIEEFCTEFIELGMEISQTKELQGWSREND